MYGSKPIVMLMHGMPEYVFYSEVCRHKQGERAFTTILAYAQEGKISRYVTMWKRHVPFWQELLGREKVFYVPPIVDMKEFSPDGPELTLKNPGTFNIGYCDTWRHSFLREPFNVFAGVKRHHSCFPDSKFHVFGIPNEKRRIENYGGLWDRYIKMLRKGSDFVGDLWQLHDNMPLVYRAMDVVITVSTDESRIIREALSCETPVIGPLGCPFVPYTCKIEGVNSLHSVLKQVREDLEKDPEMVKQKCRDSLQRMGITDNSEAFVKILESVV